MPHQIRNGKPRVSRVRSRTYARLPVHPRARTPMRTYAHATLSREAKGWRPGGSTATRPRSSSATGAGERPVGSQSPSAPQFPTHPPLWTRWFCRFPQGTSIPRNPKPFC